MTDGLDQFLRKCYLRERAQEESRRAVRSDFPFEWAYYRDQDGEYVQVGSARISADEFFEQHGQSAADPKALAAIDAKLSLLDEHPNVNDGNCGTCVDGHWGYPTHGGSSPQRHPCRTLRLLALPYADHPDYRAEWRAEEDTT